MAVMHPRSLRSTRRRRGLRGRVTNAALDARTATWLGRRLWRPTLEEARLRRARRRRRLSSR